MASIFSMIVNGAIPSHKVWEDENHYAFLDINPWVIGHTLVIPKNEVDYLFDIDDDAYLALNLAAKRVAELLQDKLGCARVCTMVIGYEVPHAHIHLLPTNTMGDIIVPGSMPSVAVPDLAGLAERFRS